MLFYANGAITKLSITETKLYFKVVRLSGNDSAELSKKLKVGFKKQLIRIKIYQNYQKKDQAYICIT